MNNIPNHVAIIMDGNRRWAKQRKLSSQKGHMEGAKNFERIALYAFNKGVKYISFFALSTENLNRSNIEVNYLMDLMSEYLQKGFKTFREYDIKIIFSGSKENLSDKLVKAMNDLEESSKNGKNGTLNLCINYGGKKEIVDACKNMVLSNVSLSDINEESIRKYFYHDLPDVDLMIRTGGDIRISNFMLYLLAYAELYFVNMFWPDFDEDEFDKALEEFSNRKRRIGK